MMQLRRIFLRITRGIRGAKDARMIAPSGTVRVEPTLLVIMTMLFPALALLVHENWTK